MRNDWISSVRMPITLFANVVMAYKLKKWTVDTQASISGMVRGTFQLVSDSLGAGGHFTNTSEALAFLEQEGYSMRQVGDVIKNRTLLNSLRGESLSLEAPGTKTGINLPVTAEGLKNVEDYEKFDKEHPEFKQDSLAPVVLEGLKDGRINEARAIEDLNYLGLTLEEALERYPTEGLKLAPAEKLPTPEYIKEHSAEPYPEDLGSNKAVDRAMADELSPTKPDEDSATESRIKNIRLQLRDLHLRKGDSNGDTC